MKSNRNKEFIKNQILRAKFEGRSPSMTFKFINKVNGLDDLVIIVIYSENCCKNKN